jgi:hypothetical protein
VEFPSNEAAPNPVNPVPSGIGVEVAVSALITPVYPSSINSLPPGLDSKRFISRTYGNVEYYREIRDLSRSDGKQLREFLLKAFFL